MPVGSEIPLNVVVSCNGCNLCLVLLMSCVSKRHTVSEVDCQSWFASLGYQAAFSPGSVRSCGCIVLLHPCLSLVNSWCDTDGRFLLYEFSCRDKLFRVANLYAPNRNPARDLFFEEVSPGIDPSVPTVICGDFNTVFDRSVDRSGSIIGDTSHESTAALSRLFDWCCVLDIWR